VSLEPIDVRFPTSRHLDGSDAMNPEPGYSAAYLTPSLPGSSAEMLRASIVDHRFPDGPVWGER